MPFEWLVALRYMRDAKAQTTLVLAAVAIGVSVIVFLSALIGGLQTSLIERTLAAVAHGVVELGVRQLVVAGGETSGACVQALNVTQMKIGPQIDPGVPWCYALTDDEPSIALHLALKSGNFGADDFFAKAFAMLE
jgi:uncharacterized protein YgbK (DUF1537 family)